MVVDLVCAYCGGRCSVQVVELVERPYPAPERFVICGGCMLRALMDFEGRVNDGELIFCGEWG